MPASSAPSSPSAPTKKRKAVVFEMDPNHLRYAKRSRTNLTIPQSSTDENPGEYKVLLIEYSSWEEKQQVELKQLRSTVALLSKEIADMREERSAKNTELRNTHQHNKSLELEKDNLHKKCDSLSRRADRWENAHNDFRPKLQEFEAQINKLVNEKHQATAMVLQEQSRNIEKNKEVRNLNRELNALAKSYQDLRKRHEQAIGRKNAAQEKSGYDLRSSADREKGPRVVKCTQCYTKKWPCDAGHPCQACIARGMPGGCKRVKCQFWTKGTCPKLRCGLAHENDGFPMVIEHRKLKQKATPLPAAVAEALNPPALPYPALAVAVAEPPTSQDKFATASTKKHERDDGDASQGNGSTKRTKVNTAVQHATHSNESNAAAIERKNSNVSLDSNGRKTQQAHTTQKEHNFDRMEQDSDPDDWVGLVFETFTNIPGFRHQSLEEYRYHDFRRGHRILYYPGGYCGIHCPGGCCAVHCSHSLMDISGWSVKFPGGPLQVLPQKRAKTSQSDTS